MHSVIKYLANSAQRTSSSNYPTCTKARAKPGPECDRDLVWLVLGARVGSCWEEARCAEHVFAE